MRLLVNDLQAYERQALKLRVPLSVLDTNKEVVMMLIGTISASIGIVVSTITGAKPVDVNALKSSLEKKEN
tara:strand:+ start:271 stop:483 length:213 start_codon:yes stop_codon:yes gene_type:complete